MIQHALTDATFTKGLNYYLNDMEYKAADPYDLYRNWEKAAREDNAIPTDARIADIMDSWAYQKGYPAIHVTRNDAGVISVKQERFLLAKLPTSQAQSWFIPYNFVTAGSADFSKTTPDGWIPKNTETITLSPTAARTWTNDEWVLFNKQQTGYYRVNYDEKLWELLGNELNDGDFKKIHVLNRAQLIDDAYTFARVSQAKYSTAFRLMEYLSEEMDYVPWVAANRALTVLDRLISGSDQYEDFKVSGRPFSNKKISQNGTFTDFRPPHRSTHL
jgi:aminopeptidase N